MSNQTLIPADSEKHVGLAGFYRAGNEELTRQLERLLDNPQGNSPGNAILYIWGESGSGKTHLLDACCAIANDLGRQGIYICLGQHAQQINEIDDCVRVSGNAVICIDEIHAIVGSRQSQIKILSIYEAVIQNSLIHNSSVLIVSGDAPPNKLGLELKDLESRLSYGSVYNIHPLSDQEKQNALKFSARARGFDLDEKVLAFIMSHYDRDTRALFTLLDKLDNASLRAQRKITVPFLKTLL